MMIFDAHSDLHVELAEDILDCLRCKSKWTTGFWTWVSLSNLKIHFDGVLVESYHGFFFPEKVCLEFFLAHLIVLGLIEKNQDLFLKDQFYKLTPLARELFDKGGDGIYNYLSTQPIA